MADFLMADLFYCSCFVFSNISNCAIAGFFDLFNGGDLFFSAISARKNDWE